MVQVINSSCGPALCFPLLSMFLYWCFTVYCCAVSTSSLNRAPRDSQDLCTHPGTGHCPLETYCLPRSNPSNLVLQGLWDYVKYHLIVTLGAEHKLILSSPMADYGHTSCFRMIPYIHCGNKFRPRKAFSTAFDNLNFLINSRGYCK